MQPKTKPQKAGSETLADQLKKRHAKDISPLEKLVFSAVYWKPLDSKKPTHVSNVERAHLRTQMLLKHLTIKLLVKHIWFNFKKSIREKFLPKA